MGFNVLVQNSVRMTDWHLTGPGKKRGASVNIATNIWRKYCSWVPVEAINGTNWFTPLFRCASDVGDGLRDQASEVTVVEWRFAFCVLFSISSSDSETKSLFAFHLSTGNGLSRCDVSESSTGWSETLFLILKSDIGCRKCVVVWFRPSNWHHLYWQEKTKISNSCLCMSFSGAIVWGKMWCALLSCMPSVNRWMNGHWNLDY